MITVGSIETTQSFELLKHSVNIANHLGGTAIELTSSDALPAPDAQDSYEGAQRGKLGEGEVYATATYPDELAIAARIDAEYYLLARYETAEPTN